jgi:hypothetical protein
MSADGNAKSAKCYVYFLAANQQTGQARIFPERFIGQIKDALKAAHKPDLKEVEFKIGSPVAEWSNVLEGLRAFLHKKKRLPDVVHFLCHGAEETEEKDFRLFFEKEVTSFMMCALFRQLRAAWPRSEACRACSAWCSRPATRRSMPVNL